MATFNKFECFVGDLGDKVHDLDADTIKVYLTNATPSASADSVKADLTEFSQSGDGYTAGGADATAVWSEASGTGTMTGTNIVWTATADWTGNPHRYAVLYNDTPTSPADPLIGWWEYPGGSITLLDTETFTITFGASLLTIT